MKRKTLPQLLLSILAVLLVCVFPPVFLYSRNAGEAAFSEILSALLIFCGVGIVMFVLCWIVMRFVLSVPMKQAVTKAAIIASLFMLVVLNYSLIEKAVCMLLPNAKYWHIVPVLLVVWLHVGYFVYHYMSDDISNIITEVICLVMGVLSIMNIGISIPLALERIDAERKIGDMRADSQDQTMLNAELPNIYMFIFDEYANFPQMETYYNYDNALLKRFLEEKNFSYSLTSHNESVMTSTIMTNVVNLDYVVDNYDTESSKEIVRKNGKLFQLMQEKGYNVQEFTVANFYGQYNPLNSDSRASDALTADGERLFDVCIRQTVFYPFYIIEMDKTLAEMMKIVDYLADAKFIPEGGTFTISHLLLSHPPFIVDSDGNRISGDHLRDWEDDSVYLGQYQFTTKQIIRILDNIVSNDPEAVIMLYSDHGARASTNSELFMVKFPLEVMNNSLNAVYYKGEKSIDNEGLSLVNTTRLMMNKVLGTEYEMIDVPSDNFAY